MKVWDDLAMKTSLARDTLAGVGWRRLSLAGEWGG